MIIDLGNFVFPVLLHGASPSRGGAPLHLPVNRLNRKEISSWSSHQSPAQIRMLEKSGTGEPSVRADACQVRPRSQRREPNEMENQKRHVECRLHIVLSYTAVHFIIYLVQLYRSVKIYTLVPVICNPAQNIYEISNHYDATLAAS